MSRKRRSEREDVLELRDLAAQRRRALVIGGIALLVLLWALVMLLDTLETSLDQQEELTDRLDAAKPPAPATASASEPTKT